MLSPPLLSLRRWMILALLPVAFLLYQLIKTRDVNWIYWGLSGALLMLILAIEIWYWCRGRHVLPTAYYRRWNRCPCCDYDLRGTPAGTCPECGFALPGDATAPAGEAREP